MKVIKYGMTEVEYACQVEKSNGSRREKVIIHKANPSVDMTSQGKDKSFCSRGNVHSPRPNGKILQNPVPLGTNPFYSYSQPLNIWIRQLISLIALDKEIEVSGRR